MVDKITVSDVGQFGPTDANIHRFKQAGQYALEAKQYAEQTLILYQELSNNVNLGNLVQEAKDSAANANNSAIESEVSATEAKQAAEEAKNAATRTNLPTLEVIYSLPKDSLKIWASGSVSTENDYWLFSDGTIWSGVGTLGQEPDTPFSQLTLQRNAQSWSSLSTKGQTVFTVPYEFENINVFLNGDLQNLSVGSYSVSGSVITFSDPLEEGDLVEVIITNVPVKSINYVTRQDLSSNTAASFIGSSTGTVEDAINSKVGLLTLSSNLGSSIIGTIKGITLQKSLDSLNTRLSSVCPEDFSGTDTEQLLAAISYAKSNLVNVQLSAGKVYKLTGTQSLNIDLGYFSFGTIMGRARIDATEFTGDAAIWVHSTVPYTLAERNHSNTLNGIDLIGSIKGTGQAGLILGNKNDNLNGTYNGDCHITNCNIKTFDIRILCTNSTWRYKFDNCGITSLEKGTYVFYAPNGLSDSGESISFDNCKFYDNKGDAIVVGCANFVIGMPGTSVLNTRIELTGLGSAIDVDVMGNYENPGQQTSYVYASVTGTGARLQIKSSTIVANNVSIQTQPLFYVGANAYIQFDHVRLIGNAYPFENGPDKLRTWVSGPGWVTATRCTNDPTSGAGSRPLHRSLSTLYNWDFETGNLDGWGFNNTGSPSQTATVGTEYAAVGAYGVQMKSIAGFSCFLTQRFPVRTGDNLTCQFWAQVVSAGTTSAGSLTYTFYSRSGVAIGTPLTATLPSVVTDWAVYGNFLQGRVPVGTFEIEVSVRCANGATINVDAILINNIN